MLDDWARRWTAGRLLTVDASDYLEKGSVERLQEIAAALRECELERAEIAA